MTPRCTLFAQSKLSLFEVYTISFTLINHSSSQQVVRIEPIPSVEDVHFSITVSDQGGPHDSGSRLEVVIKRGKSAVFLPAVKDGGVTVPKILFLLKKRFLELKGECVVGEEGNNEG